jgi:hypothetical protein
VAEESYYPSSLPEGAEQALAGHCQLSHRFLPVVSVRPARRFYRRFLDYRQAVQEVVAVNPHL